MSAFCPYSNASVGEEKIGGTMNLLEAPICAKAVARLRSKGWRVGCEIRTDNRPIDAAAILDGKVLALEAKISFNEKLRHRLKRLAIRADYVLGVVARRHERKE
jgi:hypothetical protein